MKTIADLSKYQGTIDFSKLKNVVDAVIIRVQSGSSYPDPMYKTYVAGCKQYGIPFSTYAYFKGVSIDDAIQESKDAYARMDKASITFALDIEENTCTNKANLVPAGQAFINYLKQQGVQKVGLYSGEYFYKQNGLASIKADWLWLASYGVNDGVPHTPPATSHDLWQYTSVGKLDGITQNTVDLNVLSGRKPANYWGVSNVWVGYNTGGYVGASLGEVHQYLFDKKWSFQPTKNTDLSLSFYVGEFLDGSEDALAFESYLKSHGWWYEKVIKS